MNIITGSGVMSTRPAWYHDTPVHTVLGTLYSTWAPYTVLWAILFVIWHSLSKCIKYDIVMGRVTSNNKQKKNVLQNATLQNGNFIELCTKWGEITGVKASGISNPTLCRLCNIATGLAEHRQPKLHKLKGGLDHQFFLIQTCSNICTLAALHFC